MYPLFDKFGDGGHFVLGDVDELTALIDDSCQTPRLLKLGDFINNSLKENINIHKIK